MCHTGLLFASAECNQALLWMGFENWNKEQDKFLITKSASVTMPLPLSGSGLSAQFGVVQCYDTGPLHANSSLLLRHDVTNIATCKKSILTPLLILKRASILSGCIVHYDAAYQALVGLEILRKLFNHLLCL